MDFSKALILLGAGREKKVYAVPPYTKVKSLAFEDYPFEVEDFNNKKCKLFGAIGVYLDEIIHDKTGEATYQCNDSNYCLNRLNNLADNLGGEI